MAKQWILRVDHSCQGCAQEQLQTCHMPVEVAAFDQHGLFLAYSLSCMPVHDQHFPCAESMAEPCSQEQLCLRWPLQQQQI